MTDVKLRQYEAEANAGDVRAALLYARGIAPDDKVACFENLCNVFASDAAMDSQLQEARRLFHANFDKFHIVDQGNMWRMTYFTPDDHFIDEVMDKKEFHTGKYYSQQEGIAALAKEGSCMQGLRDIMGLYCGILDSNQHADRNQSGLSRSVLNSMSTLLGVMTSSRLRWRDGMHTYFNLHWEGRGCPLFRGLRIASPAF